MKVQIPSGILSRVIGALGTDDFAAVTARELCSLLGFQQTAVFVHRPTSQPRVLFNNFEAQSGIANYIRFTHKINPMLGPTGVFRARDFCVIPGEAVAPHLEMAADEELGFRTLGWPPRQEEIGLYLQSRAGLIEIGFYRPRERSVVPERKVCALQALAEPIAAAFDRHHELTGPPPVTELSAREREVCDLMLLGCSSAAIALRLNISRYTVKDHRKHIFRKLQIGSLAELFARRSRGH
jgi:DNA-binding CsgD family transcriptional regulator